MRNFICLNRGDWIDTLLLSYVGKIENAGNGKCVLFNIVVDGANVQLAYPDKIEAIKDRERLVS